MTPEQTAINAAAASQANNAASMADHPNKAARDWSGFFAALTQFLATLAPIVLPFIVKTPADAAKKA
jgi:hypothetical protein